MAQRTPEQLRKRRHLSLRNTVAGTADRPRLVVHRSNKGMQAQVVDDRAGGTLAAASWQDAHQGRRRAPSARRRSAHWSPSAPRLRASPRSCSTAAATCTTAV